MKRLLDGGVYSGVEFNKFNFGMLLCAMVDDERITGINTVPIATENSKYVSGGMSFHCTKGGLWWFNHNVRIHCKNYCSITVPDDAIVCVEDDGWMYVDKCVFGELRYIYDSIELFSSLLVFDSAFATNEAYFFFNTAFYTENVWRIILAAHGRLELDNINVPSSLRTNQLLKFILTLNDHEWAAFSLREIEVLRAFSNVSLTDDNLKMWRARNLPDIKLWNEQVAIRDSRERERFDNFFNSLVSSNVMKSMFPKKKI